MKTGFLRSIRVSARWLILAVLASGCALTGCDDGEDDELDHDPPAGQGSLIVDNNTSTEISVYVNGAESAGVDDWDATFYDLDPGVYRVVLDEHDGDRSFAADVDILEGRRTILDVQTDAGDFDRYDVFIRFD